jgi:hypothetical protein
MTVHFSKVGRDKRSWSKDFGKTITDSAIAKEAKRGAGLMSSDVDAITNDDGSSGDIIVGGWRTVGTFTIQKGSAQ